MQCNDENCSAHGELVRLRWKSQELAQRVSDLEEEVTRLRALWSSPKRGPREADRGKQLDDIDYIE